MGTGKLSSRFSDRFSRKIKKSRPKDNTQKTLEEEKYLSSISEIFRKFKEEKLSKHRFAVMGIGNDLKGDDGIGWYVVDKLAKELAKDTDFLLIKTAVPENHVKGIRNFAPNLLILIDAADFGKGPGSIKIIKEYQIIGSLISTHTTPLTMFLRLYQADQPVKSSVTLIGIQRKNSEFGQPISDPVKRAGDMVASTIIELYKKNHLELTLDKELQRRSGPLGKITGILRKR